jgi:GT2 family glycosyltransferase
MTGGPAADPGGRTLDPGRIAAIVPNYDGIAMLGSCLDSLEAQDRPFDEIIVVDNGSTDGSAGMVRERHPGVRLIEMGWNSGFVKANNTAAASTDCGLLVLVNNDCIASPGWLSGLLGALGDDVGSVTSSMRNISDTGVLDSAGGAVNLLGFAWDIGRGLPASMFDRRAEVAFPCGGAMMIRRAALEDPDTIFWDRIFIYGEDVELGFRLWNRGWRVVYEPSAVVRHVHRATCSRAPLTREIRCIRNRLIVLRRHLPPRKLARIMPVIVLWQVLWALSSLARFRFGVFRAVVEGTARGLAGRVERYPGADGHRVILRFAGEPAGGFPKAPLERMARRALEG